MIENVAVLGAGTMGAGIAQACAQSGLDVTLRDVEDSYLDSGIKRLKEPLETRIEQGKTTREAVDAIFAHITPTTDLETAVENADLVIEAVPEDLEIKHKVFAEVDELAPDDAILATNTSSLRVADIAHVTDRPDRFAGLHFFYPAQINKLLEIVVTDDTDPEVHRELERFGHAIGKALVETADTAGFCVNRFFVPWVNEAVRLLDEGVANTATIDAAAKQAFNVPMGPFKLMNETGVPISLHAQRSLHKAFGSFYQPAEGLVHQVEEVGEDWRLDGEVHEAAFDEIQQRLQGVVFAIASQLVDENVATPVDTDKGAIVGLAWRQGPFAMMNEEGLDTALERVQRLAERYDGLQVPENLQTRATNNEAWELPTVAVNPVNDAVLLRIQQPATRNALSTRVLHDLEDAINQAEASDARVIILTGEATTFVAGADIQEMRDKDEAQAREYADHGQRVTRRLEQSPLPVIAAINGYAFGGGLELALAADILLASNDATLGLPETSLGIQPGFGGTQRLPRHVGLQRANQLVFTADRISGPQAAEYGLVLDSVPRAELLDEALALAAKIADNAPLAIRNAKRSIQQGYHTDLDEGLAIELDHASTLFDTEDQIEGMDAFLERRDPDFQGQ